MNLVVPLTIEIEQGNQHTVIRGFVGSAKLFVPTETEARKFATAGDAALYVADHSDGLSWMQIGKARPVREDASPVWFPE